MNYGTESRQIFLKGIDDNKHIPDEYKPQIKELIARQFQIITQYVGVFELMIHREQNYQSTQPKSNG